jgi:hypothetical protein
MIDSKEELIVESETHPDVQNCKISSDRRHTKKSRRKKEKSAVVYK